MKTTNNYSNSAFKEMDVNNPHFKEFIKILKLIHETREAIDISKHNHNQQDTKRNNKILKKLIKLLHKLYPLDSKI